MAEFKTALQEIAFSEPQLPFISNLTGQWATAEQVCQPEYWVQHLRHTVQYDAGLRTLLERRADDNWVLLEVGPRQILSTLASRHPALGMRPLSFLHRATLRMSGRLRRCCGVP